MAPRDDRIAKRLAKVRAELAELDHEAATKADAEPQVIARREGKSLRSALWSAVFFVGLVVLAAGLMGVAVTLSRFAGEDFGDAQRTGQATVTRCAKHGPITNRGFGHWERCDARIRWDDGEVSDHTVDRVFTSADIGKQVRVGDIGNYRQSKDLARADSPHRPWLRWIGYVVGAVALVPTLVVVLLLREMLRFRRR